MFRRFVLPASLGLILLAGAGAAAAQTPTRVRGTVSMLTGNVLTVSTRSGDKVPVTLGDGVRVVAIVKAPLAEVQPGRNVGIASQPQPDGSLRALSVLLIPAGQSINALDGPWDLTPSSRMTNGAVASVVAADGLSLTVNYGSGEKKIAIPATTPVVTSEPGTPAMLAPGAAVVVFARKAENGTLTAGAVAVGKDGVVPPM
jgi:hypothetical protein